MIHLDPDLVLWTTVVANVFCVAASATAAIATIKHYLYALRRDAQALGKRLND